MKKLTALLLAVILVFALFAGCNGNTAPSPTPSQTPTQNTSQTPDGETPDLDEPVTFPLVDRPRKFTKFCRMDPQGAAALTTYAENMYWKEMEKLTNVSFEWIQPMSTAATEAFNLMLASQVYDDVIYAFQYFYANGIDDAIDNEIIHSLNDYMQYMPNMNALLRADESYMLQAVTDMGNLWGFQCILLEEQGPWGGLVLREDLLQKFGMSTPETYSDLEDYLVECRDQEGMIDGPFRLATYNASYMNSINSGFNIGSTLAPFTCIDGKATLFVTEPAYREYVELLRDWFSKGLVQQDYYTVTGASTAVPDMAAGKIALVDNTWDLTSFETSLPAPMVVKATSNPVRNSGEVAHIRQSNPTVRIDHADVVSTHVTAPEDIIVLCKFYDYMFSEEGAKLANWGIEGETFVYNSEGKPEYTELIMNNPDGLSFLGANVVYLGGRNMPGIYEWRRELTESATNCMDTWFNANDDWIFPMAATMTAAEGQEYALIFSECQTYILEKVTSFIIGSSPMDEWDEFLQQLENMNLDRCTEIKQASLDRYFGRLDNLG